MRSRSLCRQNKSKATSCCEHHKHRNSFTSAVLGWWHRWYWVRGTELRTWNTKWNRPGPVRPSWISWTAALLEVCSARNVLFIVLIQRLVFVQLWYIVLLDNNWISRVDNIMVEKDNNTARVIMIHILIEQSLFGCACCLYLCFECL